MDDAFASLRSRIDDKTATVGIIGLGYVGLPLARAFVDGGFPVLGFDVDPAKVERLRRGESYIGHITAEVIRQMAGRFEATDRFDRLDEPDAVIICVPTPLTETREPDLSYIVSSARAIAARLRPGQLVVLESTTYPGTTARRASCRSSRQAGLTAGQRLLPRLQPRARGPGQPELLGRRRSPRSSAASTPRSRELAARPVRPGDRAEVVPVSSREVAEACKILENTYRAVNIALVNELKVLYDRMGIDVWEVIDAAKTKPFGFQAFYPGPGLGGHCIPIDPFYLTWVARKYGHDHAVHRAGRRDQHGDARTTSSTRVADALNDARQAGQGEQDRAPGHGVQEGRGRPARVARRSS